MNKRRRKEIYSIINKLNQLIHMANTEDKEQLISQIRDISDDVGIICCDEESYKDNIPENLQNGYRYEAAEEACDNLESAQDSLEYIDEEDTAESIVGALKEAINYLEDASQ